uniref:Uncharacterized protein n=1 Tax=Oryza rufipogon TaxID=4529 RepID=A0A0E0RGB7_ORYRU
MGSVEVAATWYGGGRESMRGGSGEASGVARTAAAPLLQRQGARRGGEGCREHLHQGGDNMQRETAPPDPDIAACP